MKRSELRKIIKEEITKVLNESSPSSILLDVELDDDTIDDWENDPQTLQLS